MTKVKQRVPNGNIFLKTLCFM